MITKERMVRILNKIQEHGFVSVKELMEELEVSRSSVMRDLIELENQGLVQRERGGASLVGVSQILTSFNEPAVVEKEHLLVAEKKRICRVASQLVHDGDCVYIDSGTTPVYLLDELVNKKIKIVTPSTFVARKLPSSFMGDLYLLGGEFNKAYDMSYGSLTLDMISQFHFDVAFLSTNGVDLKSKEVFVFDFNVGAIKKAIMERSMHSELLMDASKYNVRAMCTWAHLDDFHSVFVDDYDFGEEIPDNFVVCEDEDNR